MVLDFAENAFISQFFSAESISGSVLNILIVIKGKINFLGISPNFTKELIE